MLRNLILAACGAAMLASGADSTRAPVLIELFTSEGCSSCPPADRLLELLDSQAIVLSEHVDYWDRLGWRDPYSSHANTLRQQTYARVFGKDGPYTPQMVIDGTTEFVGNDAPRATQELARARSHEKLGVHLTRTADGVQVRIDAASKAAEVWLALAEDRGTQQVASGENKGRTLHHVAILRSLRKLGVLKKGAEFSQMVEAPANGGRLIVFVQEGGFGRVYGVGAL
ncbi:MAG: DUF1223 domain-containing protein [Candidatus Solibacter sp.]